MLHTLVVIGFIVVLICVLVDTWDVIVEWLIYIAAFVMYGYVFYSTFITEDKWFY